jgi:hypothetical protein
MANFQKTWIFRQSTLLLPAWSMHTCFKSVAVLLVYSTSSSPINTFLYTPHQQYVHSWWRGHVANIHSRGASRGAHASGLAGPHPQTTVPCWHIQATQVIFQHNRRNYAEVRFLPTQQKLRGTPLTFVGGILQLQHYFQNPSFSASFLHHDVWGNRETSARKQKR